MSTINTLFNGNLSYINNIALGQFNDILNLESSMKSSLKSPLISSALLSLLITFLSACGGGSKEPGVVIPPLPENYEISFVGPSNNSALVGESVGIVLQSPETTISDIQWSQTSGSSLNYLGANRKVIGFDILEAGNYAFNVQFKDSEGGARSADYSFAATISGQVYVNARLDHEANSRSKMSLVGSVSFPGSLSTVSWTQIAGPTADIESTNELSIYFTAPEVQSDTLLQFQVSASDNQGNEGSDIINILLEPETVNPNSFFNSGRFADYTLADVYAYKPASTYAAKLEECIYSNTTTDYCNLASLPFLGSVDSTPSVAQIMDRVLVSHDWMGARFQTFLEQVDVSDDIKNLLGATRSIVISYDIRPSFFWSGTGAIYINAAYFWVTVQERDTLDIAPDFRSDFSKDLQFRDPWRISKDNVFAYYTPSQSSRLDRTLDEYKYSVLRVFYHELAHANDFFPPRAWSSTNGSDFPFTYSNNNDADSVQLSISYPLNSQEMYSLGDVMFQGNTASQTQINYTPDDVSQFFFPNQATNTYNYSTKAEDYAMLTEEYLMGYRYGILYDQGITGLAPDYVISQAERGRIGHDRITPRAEFVINNILPNIDVNVASATLAAPIILPAGVNWRDTVEPPTKMKNLIYKTDFEQPILLGQDLHSNNMPSFNH